MNLHFFLLVSKQENVVVVLIISMIQMQNCVFLSCKKFKCQNILFNLMSITNAMKKDTQNGMKRVNAIVSQMHVFVLINNVEMKINADVNIKN